MDGKNFVKFCFRRWVKMSIFIANMIFAMGMLAIVQNRILIFAIRTLAKVQF